MGFVDTRVRSNNYIQPLMMALILFLTLKFSSYLFYPLSDFNCLIIALLYCFLNIASSNVEYYNSNKFTGFIQEILAVLLWAILMYMVLALIVFIFQIPQYIAIYLLLIIVALGIYGYANAHHLVIKEETLKLDNLENELNIAHISDVHIGAIRRKSLVKKLVIKLKDVNPDIAIISGDLADGYASLKEDTFEDFKNLDFPVVFTPGNHDLYQGLENIKRIASKGGITILDNEAMKFKGLNIHGLSFRDNPESFLDVPNWELMWKINKEENNLIIFHFPYYWNEFQQYGFNIQLSGHSHGCQFYPAIFFAKLMFPYNKGLFENKGNYLNVSEGVGTMGPPIRIGTNSSITLLKLRKK